MFPVQDQLILCTSHCLYIAICTNNSMSCGNALALVHLKILKQSLQNLQISWQTKQECFFTPKITLDGVWVVGSPGVLDLGFQFASNRFVCHALGHYIIRAFVVCCLFLNPTFMSQRFLSYLLTGTEQGLVRFINTIGLLCIYIYVCWSIPCANLVALPHKNTVRYSRLNGLLPRR